MDEEDRNDIIKKINTSGDDSEDSDNNDNDNGSDNNDGNDNGGNDDFGGGNEFSNGEDEEGLEEIQIFENEDLFLDEPVRNNMFQEGSNDILDDTNLNESFISSGNNSIFTKKHLLNKLHESLNQGEPITVPAPVVKPETVPSKPSRRKETFLPKRDVQPDPKAANENTPFRPKPMKDYETYHRTFSSAVQTAREMAELRGYEISDDEWFNTIATGPKKPSDGETNRYTLTLYNNGKEQRKALHIQVYGMGDKYELNTYIA